MPYTPGVCPSQFENHCFNTQMHRPHHTDAPIIYGCIYNLYMVIFFFFYPTYIHTFYIFTLYIHTYIMHVLTEQNAARLGKNPRNKNLKKHI